MSERSTLAHDLELAHELVGLASEIALAHFERGPQAKTKGDGSPVTDADVEVERCLVERLVAERPDDGILGEELGARGSSSRRWILDPIDGTFNFVAANPQWGTHVALEREGELVLGMISRPVFARRWWATRGGGAHRGDVGSLESATALSVSTVSNLRESRVAVWAEAPHDAISRVRGCAQHVAPDLDAVLDLAEGRLDALVDTNSMPWDHAPAVMIVEEAGGRFTDREGGRRIDLGEGRYSNGRIHAALAAALDA